MAGRDDLIKQIGRLLIQGQIAQLVNNQECRLGVNPKLANQRVIDLRGVQVVEHVHGRGEQNTLIGLAGTPADDFGQECLAHTGVADEHDAGALVEKLQVEQAHDAVLRFHATLVVLEVETVDGVLGMQAGHAEAAFDGAAVARVEFEIGERFQPR